MEAGLDFDPAEFHNGLADRERFERAGTSTHIEGIAMRKLVAVMMAGLFAAGAYAQNPAGTSSQEQVITDSKPQQRAQSRVDARPQGKVKKPGGDQATSAQSDAIGTGRAAAAGQARATAREDRNPNRAPAKQGGTPDMAGAR
ncbi:cell envelope biogenesis protein TolA [Variovorax saccharolyticus]|uniref:cell envelope biogenesis protein TolA n=1 Tax=Variovorax saccharolyticus TaxID=3053516 RepID=UPI0025782478|nr:cell envelope biogenesis protein TolA [Variovorax sp. J31P216]MDM0027402.1 cell envelope biogenesis protein TolA [Variovorax sp. J31P216]